MKRPLGKVAAALFALAALSVAFAQTVPAGARSVARTRSMRPGSQALHLYVSDPVRQQVARFPLYSGIPAQEPDAVLTGFERPLGVAIGPNDGRLYVVDAGAKKLLIYEPAPTSTSTPSHILSLKQYRHGLGAIAVDQGGYVYLSYQTFIRGNYAHPNPNVAIYRPLPSGKERRIENVQFYDDTGPFGLGVSSQEVLAAGIGHVDFGRGKLGIASGMPKREAPPGYLYCTFVPYGIAWDSSNVLYIGDLGAGSVRRQIDILPSIGYDCPGMYVTFSSTVPITDPTGVAVNGGFLYATSSFNRRVGSAVVFVLDPTIHGPQKPKAILGGKASGLRAAYNIAIGP